MRLLRLLVIAALAAAFAPASALAAAPVISSFSPGSGTVGTAVTLNGSGFTGATDVSFTGASASFTVVDDSRISTSVPNGATTGKIVVNNPDGRGTSATNFRVKPKIDGFTPASGPVGTTVTISGSALLGASAVTFNGTPATYNVDSYSQITATVPDGATSGPIGVTTKYGTATSATSFTVTASVPTVSLAPTTGPPGTSVVVTGANFAAGEAVDVYFDASAIALAVADGTGAFGITISVPADAAPGSHSVTAIGRRSVRAAHAPFTVTAPAGPALSLAPSVGPPKSRVGVSGSRFGANEAVDVYFDTKDLALVSTDGAGGFSAVKIMVPRTAEPGTHWVTAVGRVTGRSAQAEFLVRTDWAQFRWSNQHTGFNSLENVLDVGNVSGLDVAWRGATGGAIGSSPAVAGGVAYVGSQDSKLHAFDTATGAQLWAAPTDDWVSSSPAVSGGVVYVGSRAGTLYALDASNGAQLWSAPIGGLNFSSPAVANGIVYIGANDKKLHAFAAQNGAPLWAAPTGGTVASSPAVANGLVYVGSYDGKLYAFDAQSGVQRWSVSTNVGSTSSPAVANGVVYIGTDGFHLYAFNAATGAPIWTATTDDSVYSSPAVAGGVVYVGSWDGKVHAFDAQSGGELWNASTGGGVYSSPAVANGVVYVGGVDSRLYAFSAATGAQLWSAVTGDGIFSSPAVADGMVYVASLDGGLYAYGLPGFNGSAPRPNPKRLVPDKSLRLSR
jgi:outer membrane protein assembly factor BamB